MKAILVLWVALAFVLCQNVPLVRFNLTQVNSLATCNDGTSGVVYLRSGTGSGANRFVIRLQGGGWCYDEASCASRAQQSPQWITSRLCPAELLDNQTIAGVGHEGILSSNPVLNPSFYNWNHVYVWYCSSDSHIGNISKSPANGWGFNGKNIVHAVMTTIIQKMNLAAATDILLTGDSAGGVATVNNVDYIGEFVSQVVPTANYRAFVDCAWFLNIPVYGSSNFSFFQEVAQKLITNANVQYDESCVNHFGDEKWMCFHTQYSWPYIQTLSFYQEFQFDSANLGMDNAPTPWNSSTQAFALNFQKDMLLAQADVPYLFSPNCYIHETIDSTLFTSIAIGNISISDAVSKWFFTGSYASPPPLMRYVDVCTGIACNPTCPK